MTTLFVITVTLAALPLTLSVASTVRGRRERKTIKRALRRAFPARSVGYRGQRCTDSGTDYAQLSAPALRYPAA